MNRSRSAACLGGWPFTTPSSNPSDSSGFDLDFCSGSTESSGAGCPDARGTPLYLVAGGCPDPGASGRVAYFQGFQLDLARPTALPIALSNALTVTFG